MQFTHIANPVRVNAAQILEVSDAGNGNMTLRLSDGRNYAADSSMTIRNCPVAGDYLVTQADGYEYLNPKAVFERKYSVGGPKSLIVITVQDTANGAVVSLASEPPMDMSAAPVGEAQHLAHLMLGALPMNAEMVAPPAVAPSCPSCGGEGFVNTGIDEAPRAECGKCNGTGE